MNKVNSWRLGFRLAFSFTSHSRCLQCLHTLSLSFLLPLLGASEGSEAENQLFSRLVVSLTHRRIFVTTHTSTHTTQISSLNFFPLMDAAIHLQGEHTHTLPLLIGLIESKHTVTRALRRMCVCVCVFFYKHFVCSLQTDFLKTVSHETRAMRLSFELI